MNINLTRIAWAMLVALAISLGAVDATAAVASPELSAMLARTPADREIPIIIRLKNKPDMQPLKRLKQKPRRRQLIKTLKRHAEADQAGLVRFLGQKTTGKLKSLWLINALAVTATPDLIRQLDQRKEIDSIVPDSFITLADANPAVGGSAMWNLSMIQADTLQSLGYAGQGVVVAGMDSGVDAQHNALAGAYRGGSNSWYDPNGQHADPYDADGHGTQTMSVMVADSGIGVAPMARWIAVKIFDDSGLAPISGIHSGFQWLLDPDGNPDTDDAPDIVNNSWGFKDNTDECLTEFEADIATLRLAGIAVVFAAGNNGPSAYTSISPANNPGSLAVGALDSDAQVIPMSSIGPSACTAGLYPHLSAPGLSIYTADLTSGGAFPDMTTHVSGTSFSAPHVAGALALLRSAFPDATVAELEQALWDSALDLGISGPDDSYGYGLVQASTALDVLMTQFPTCTDADGDGFFSADSDPACGGPVDCADTDPDVYPGALDIPNDGIDQDCNGYDLTIRVTRAEYLADKDRVVVFATSDLAETAALQIDLPWLGTRSMVWDSVKKHWKRRIGNAVGKGFDPADPGSVRVSGPEGEVSAAISGGIIPPTCTDADGDGFFSADSDPACGGPVDCADTDPDVYPGALDIPNDGIDQDCNGYDLTIRVTRAEYLADKDRVVVFATSDLAETAGLQIDLPWLGTRSMTWDSVNHRWKKSIGGAVSKGFDPADPGSVRVSGPEGEVNVLLTLD